MTLTNEAKLEIVGKRQARQGHRLPKSDRAAHRSASAELTEHLRTHKKDTTRGAAAQARQAPPALLGYLQRTNLGATAPDQELGLRR
jgi:ribosomal protein S15P/S13E